MIRVCPFEDLAAMAVFRQLDVHDHMEAELVRGVPYTTLGLFAEWRMAQAHGPLSLIATTGSAERPFAIFCLGHTGQAGVAQGALLAAHHDRHRIALARLALAIRDKMPAFAAETGIHRIEARCWAGHPTAARLLTGMGFAHEADLSGFGRDGAHTFRQFAWTRPATTAATAPAKPQPHQTEEF